MSTKRKLPTKLGQPMVKPTAKPAPNTILRDAQAVVSKGGAEDSFPVNSSSGAIEISSDSGSSVISEGEDDEAEPIQDTAMTEASQINAEDEDEDSNAEPTFGDLVRTTLEPISVSAAFPQALSHAPNNLLSAPSSASLSTVLTQALKTNDTALLETCLQTADLPTIRTTIQRLSSPLASVLLSVLASRLHKRPGRAGSLMVWIQWTLVAHGGYLASQKEVITQLKSLQRVVDERARGLTGLLQLKGKLDMLEAQGALRQAMMGAGRRSREDDDEEDDDDVVYVEGQSDDDDEHATTTTSAANKSRRFAGDIANNDDDSGNEDMPNTAPNGLLRNSDSEDDMESEDGSEGMIDDEAEESNDDGSAVEEVDFEDEDELDSGDESEDAAPARGAPPTKLQKVGGLFSKRAGKASR